MRKTPTRLLFIIPAFLMIFLCSCGKSKNNRPTIRTIPVTEITSNSAVTGGNITNDQNEAVIERGVCWDTTGIPTINSNKIINGAGMWDFTVKITGLLPNTKYYVRAYATIRPYEVDPYTGAGYGNLIAFKTLP
jgi:hypothetical protein